MKPRQQTLPLAKALERGIEFLRAGKRSEAEQLFQAILKAKPDHPDARHFLGVLRFQQGRPDEALELLNGVLRTHPSSPFVLSNLAFVLYALARFEESLDCLDRALALNPNHPEALHNRGNALRELGRHEEALQSYARAIETRPGYAEPYNGRASVLMEQGKWADVEKALRECVAIAPQFAEAQVNLGLLLLQLGRNAEATAQAQIAAGLEKQVDFPHHGFAQLLARTGQAQAAERHFRIALSRDPQDRQGSRLLLAALGAEPLPDRLPPSFVGRLYGKRALAWDRMMGEGQYSGARLVAEALIGVAGSGASLDILDAGCGTGLVGELLKDCARKIDGVDTSGDMLARATAKSIYATLQKGDLVEFFQTHPASYDAITCAATLIHFGDLRAPFGAAKTALRNGGWLVFTLFANENDEATYEVGSFDGFAQGGCYAHGSAYVESTAKASGFEVVELRKAIHEYHYGVPKSGLIVVLRRSAA